MTYELKYKCENCGYGTDYSEMYDSHDCDEIICYDEWIDTYDESQFEK